VAAWLFARDLKGRNRGGLLVKSALIIGREVISQTGREIRSSGVSP
jgi:hypothetical protein